MSNSSLANLTVKANASNYTAGRQGNKINHITVHHMAGVLTAAQCGAIFAAKGRGGSAHYGIGSDGKIALYVDEKNIAWSDANWKSNCTTVSIETSNSKTGGNWPVSDKSFKLLVKLVADIAKRNKLGKLVVGKNLFGHRDFASTVCPGPYLYGKLKEFCALGNRRGGGFNDYLTLRISDRHCGCFRTAHHNSFHKRLTAYGRFFIARDPIFFFFLHLSEVSFQYPVK